MNSLSNTSTLKGLSLIVAGLFFFSCKQENHDLQLPGEAELPANTIYSDTFSVDLSSVLVQDDYSTSNPSRDGVSYIMAGGYQDDDDANNVFGNTRVNAFSQLILSQEYIDLSDIQIDSAALELDYDYAYGDTNETQTLNVYPLMAVLDPSAVYYANSTEPAYDSGSPLGSFTFKAKPATGTNLRFSIPANNSLVNTIVTGPKNNAAFVNAVKGLAFIPANDNGAVIRFNLSSSRSRIFIYYQQSDSSKVYELNFTGKRYFTVHQDRSGAALSGLVNVYDLMTSDLTSNSSYIQAGSGVRTKITFPNISNFVAGKGNIYIHKAELVLPVSGSHLPDSTYLVRAGNDGHATFTNNFVNSIQKDANPVSGYIYTQYGVLSEGAYTFQLRAYLQALVYGEVPNHGLILTPIKNNVEFSNAMLNNQDASSNQVKLKIYYTAGK